MHQAVPAWPPGDGEMAERVRVHDWDATSLGPVARWPQALKTAVELMLASPMLASLAVGRERVFLYNDLASRHYGSQHPDALGRPLPNVFAHEFAAVAPFYDRVFAGESLHIPAQPLDPAGSGRSQNFDAYLAPVRDDQGTVIAAWMTGFAADDRLRSEAVLRDSEERLAAELSGTELLRDLAERLVPEESPRTFYKEILSAAITITRSDAGTVQLYEPETGSLVLLVTRGFARNMTDHFHRVDANSHTACGIALRTGARTFIDFDDETDEACAMHIDAGYRSAQATPLVSRNGAPIGMLNTHWHASHHRPKARELRFLDLLARQAADLIEASQTRRKLIEREADLARVQRIGAVGGLDIDVVDGMRSWRSPEYLELHGLPQDRRREDHEEWRRRVHPDDRERAEWALDEALSGDAASYENEYRIVRPSDGAVRWIHARADIERDATGKPIRLVGAHIDVTAQKIAQAALEESEGNLRSLFESMGESFYLIELVRDQAGQVADVRYLLENRVAREWIGYSVLGKLLSEANPEFDRGWLTILERVAATGETEQFERYSPLAQRWEDFRVFPVGEQDRIGVLGSDVTERVKAQSALRESEERQAFLLELSDSLRPLSDPRDIQQTAMTLLAERYDVMRAGYLDLDQDGITATMAAHFQRDASPVPETIRLSDYGADIVAAFRDGRTQFVRDTEAEADTEEQRAAHRAIGIRAWIIAPLVKAGRLIAIVGVVSKTPRNWTPVEVQLVTDLAERTWDAVQRATAETVLRESEERQAFLLELSDALRGLADPIAIEEQATRLLARHLKVSRATYATFVVEGGQEYVIIEREHCAPGTPSLVGRHPADATPDDIASLRAGRATVIPDVEAEPMSEKRREAWRALGARARMGVPLVKDGRLVVVLGVHDAAPRDWSPDDIELVRETGERTWAAVERTRSEAALRDSEERMGTLLTLMPAAVYACDTEGRLTFYNRRAVECWGRAPRLGDTEDRWCGSLRMWLPDGSPLKHDNCPMVDAAGRGESCRNVEVVIEQPSGARIVASVNIDPLYDADGRLAGAINVFEDVTEQKRAEAALRESELRFRGMADNISQLAWICDRLGNVIWYNQRWIDYTGMTFEEMQGWGWNEVQHPDHVDRVVAGVKRAAETGEPWEDTFPLRRHDGEWRWFDSRAMPIRDEAGTVIRWFGTNTDITAQRESEQALRDSEERLRQFGEASQDVLWIRDAETLQWTYLTPAFEDIYGVSREAALAGENYSNWLDLIIPEDREYAAASIARVRKGEHAVFEFRIQRPSDGQIRWLRNTDFPIAGADGNVLQIGGIGSDITERKRIETVLEQNEDRLTLLVAELQHRVRNILAVVRSVFSRTVETSDSIEDLTNHFKGRLDSLARTQVIVTQSETGSADLESLIREELLGAGATEELDLTIQGPKVGLPAHLVEILSLALHELATNSVKYGAIAFNSKLTITWRTNLDHRSQSRLMLTWLELGIPLMPVSPTRQGFGTELIRDALPYRLDAETVLEFKPGGVRCVIDVPLTPDHRGDSDLGAGN